MITFKQLLEILDRPAKYEVFRNTDKLMKASVEIGGREIELRFNRWPEEGKWNFTFVEIGGEDDDYDEDGTYDVTGSGNEFEVFATAKAFLLQAIKEKSPKVVYFEADKMQNATRARLYDKLVSRWKLPGYTFRQLNDTKETRYYAFIENSFYQQTYGKWKE